MHVRVHVVSQRTGEKDRLLERQHRERERKKNEEKGFKPESCSEFVEEPVWLVENVI